MTYWAQRNGFHKEVSSVNEASHRRSLILDSTLVIIVSMVAMLIPTQYVQAAESYGELYASPANLHHGVASFNSVNRSWYGQTLSLLSRQETGTSYYDGNNVGIELDASCPVDGFFDVALYRVDARNSRVTSFIGSASFKRNGFTKATWQNVGPGNYKFVFSKSNDGAVVTSSNVATYSW